MKKNKISPWNVILDPKEISKKLMTNEKGTQYINGIYEIDAVEESSQSQDVCVKNKQGRRQEYSYDHPLVSEARRLLQTGIAKARVAAALGVHNKTLYRWGIRGWFEKK